MACAKIIKNCIKLSRIALTTQRNRHSHLKLFKTNAFQIKPDLENIIPPMEVKKIIGKILNETLLSR